LIAGEDAVYDVTDEIDLSTLEPLIAKPSSPGTMAAVARSPGRRSARWSSAPRR